MCPQRPLSLKKITHTKMKIIYNSYSDIMRFMRSALSGFTIGLLRLLWSVALLAINTGVFAWRKLASAITRKPVAALAVVLAIMTIANLATYASMKAKLTTAEWRYDRLRIHMDSVYEAYNIHSSYSRIVSYEKAK